MNGFLTSNPLFPKTSPSLMRLKLREACESCGSSSEPGRQPP